MSKSTSVDARSKLTVYHRVGQVFTAANLDVTHSKNRLKTIVVGLAAVVTQILDRLRFAVVIIPYSATKVFESTHSPLYAALAAAGIFWVWSGGVGEVLNYGLAEFQRGKAMFKRCFPAVVDVFRDGLPGMADRTARIKARQLGDKSLVPYSSKKGLHFFTRNMRRGLTSVGIGSTAFVATASVDGYSTRETTKLNLIIATNGSIVVAIVVGAISTALLEMPKYGYLDATIFLQNVFSDIRFWYLVAAISIVAEFIGNRYHRKKFRKESISPTTNA